MPEAETVFLQGTFAARPAANSAIEYYVTTGSNAGKRYWSDGATWFEQAPEYAPGGTDIPITDGGTGASSASAARTNLGLVIGTDVAAFAAAASQGEMEAGTEAALRSVSPLRVKQAIAALASGSVATDAIWDAAGDLAVGSGANTAARLALGAAGGFVSRINGAVAWNSGTSFPTAATGDRYWRTDLGMEFYYDGTQWRSLQIMSDTLVLTDVSVMPFVVTAAAHSRSTIGYGTNSLYLINAVFSHYVATTLDGTNYWVSTLVTDPNDGTGGTTRATQSMISRTADRWYKDTVAIGTVVTSAVASVIRLTTTKTLAPGGCFALAKINYQVIAT